MQIRFMRNKHRQLLTGHSHNRIVNNIKYFPSFNSKEEQVPVCKSNEKENTSYIDFEAAEPTQKFPKEAQMCLSVASVLKEENGKMKKEGVRGELFNYSELKIVSMKEY